MNSPELLTSALAAVNKLTPFAAVPYNGSGSRKRVRGWPSGRASAFQADLHGFDSRTPLQICVLSLNHFLSFGAFGDSPYVTETYWIGATTVSHASAARLSSSGNIWLNSGCLEINA
jgi:hypothetical protein